MPDTEVVEPTAPETPAAAAAGDPPAPAAPVVPETYDLKLPEGSALDAAIVERTAATARALGLTNDAAQQLLDHDVALLTARQAAEAEARQATIDAWKPGGSEWTKRDAAWTAQAKADPELGKTPEEFSASLERARQALEKYGPETKALLDETGFGSHPAVLRMLARVGRAMAEPGFVVGASAPSARPKSDAQLMYPNHYTDDGSPKPV